MYEHSFHMDYGAKAAAYVDAFMNISTGKTFPLFIKAFTHLSPLILRSGEKGAHDDDNERRGFREKLEEHCL